MSKSCTLCSQNKSIYLYSTKKHPLFEGVKEQPYLNIRFFPLSIKQCQNCGFIFSETLPESDLQIDKFYKSNVSMTSAPIDKSNHTSKIAKNFTKIIEENTSLSNESKVLEIGCREGLIISELRQKFNLDITGIDISGADTIKDKKGALKKIKDYFPSPKLTGKFDLIYSKAVLEHVPNINSFLSGVKNHLKPNGIFICQVPNTTKSLKLGNIGIFIFEHISFFTSQSLTSSCKNNGLEPIKITEDEASLTILCKPNLNPSSKTKLPKPIIYNPKKFTDSINNFQKHIKNNEIEFFGASPDLFNYFYLTIKNTPTQYNIYDNDQFKRKKYFGLNTVSIKDPKLLKGKNIAIMPVTYLEEIYSQVKNLNYNAKIINIWKK